MPPLKSLEFHVYPVVDTVGSTDLVDIRFISSDRTVHHAERMDRDLAMHALFVDRVKDRFADVVIHSVPLVRVQS